MEDTRHFIAQRHDAILSADTSGDAEMPTPDSAPQRFKRGLLIGFCLTIDAAIVAWALLPFTGV
jgi:hypothetical protein